MSETQQFEIETITMYEPDTERSIDGILLYCKIRNKFGYWRVAFSWSNRDVSLVGDPYVHLNDGVKDKIEYIDDKIDQDISFYSFVLSEAFMKFTTHEYMDPDKDNVPMIKKNLEQVANSAYKVITDYESKQFH